MLTWQISVTLPILSQTKSWEEIYNSTSLYILPYGYNRHTLVQCSKIIRKWKSFEYLYAITFNIELDKAVVCVIRLASFLWLQFQCVCPLMPSCKPLPSYLGFSYLGWGVFPHRRPSWPWTWNSCSRPSCAHAAAAPWTWGCSSWSPPLTSDVG